MQAITTLDLDIAKSVFQVHGVDALAKSSSVISSSGVTCWHSFRSCHRAWSVSKPALHRIIGHANSRHSATLFA